MSFLNDHALFKKLHVRYRAKVYVFDTRSRESAPRARAAGEGNPEPPRVGAPIAIRVQACEGSYIAK